MRPKEIYRKYKIRSKKELRDYLLYEKSMYYKYYRTKKNFVLGVLKGENIIKIMRWQRISRIADYYDYMYHTLKSIKYLIPYLWYSRKRNKLGNRIGLEINTALIGKGLVIYHFNNVINGDALIGENCHIHGTVVIGNGGPQDLKCPIIGDNVMIGAGARIIGNVVIADNIKIGAGAVVVNSFTEKGITIGGIPARKLK